MADMNQHAEDAEHSFESDRKIGKMNWDLEEINMVSAQLDLHLLCEETCTSDTELHQLMMERVMMIRKMEEQKEIPIVTQMRMKYLENVKTYCNKQYPLLSQRKEFSEISKMTFGQAKDYENVLVAGQRMKEQFAKAVQQDTQEQEQTSSDQPQSLMKRTSNSSDLSIMENYLEKKQKTEKGLTQTHFKGDLSKKFNDKYFSHRYFKDDNHNEMLKVHKKVMSNHYEPLEEEYNSEYAYACIQGRGYRFKFMPGTSDSPVPGTNSKVEYELVLFRLLSIAKLYEPHEMVEFCNHLAYDFMHSRHNMRGGIAAFHDALKYILATSTFVQHHARNKAWIRCMADGSQLYNFEDAIGTCSKKDNDILL